MPDALPHEAITRAVHAAFGRSVQVTATDRLCGDASNRVYLRIALTGVGTAAGPATAVVMLLGEGRFQGGGDELGSGRTSELPFVDVGRYLARHHLPVPALYHDASTTDGLLLLEDIGDTNLWSVASAEPARVDDLFAQAIELLVQLQRTGHTQPDPSCCAFRRRFDGALAHAEVEHFIDHGIDTRHGRPLPAVARAEMLAALAAVEEPFRTAPPVLAHRDYMAWNLHWQHDRLRLIDFQDALLAPDAYDLAALLTDRHTPSLVTPDREAALIAQFVASRRAAGLPVHDDFPRHYRLCALHRALKVIGRFYFLEVVKGKPGYLAYLPGVYAVARRMFDALPQLEPARALIVPWVPELRAGATT